MANTALQAKEDLGAIIYAQLYDRLTKALPLSVQLPRDVKVELLRTQWLFPKKEEGLHAQLVIRWQSGDGLGYSGWVWPIFIERDGIEDAIKEPSFCYPTQMCRFAECLVDQVVEILRMPRATNSIAFTLGLDIDKLKTMKNWLASVGYVPQNASHKDVIMLWRRYKRHVKCRLRDLCCRGHKIPKQSH